MLVIRTFAAAELLPANDSNRRDFGSEGSCYMSRSENEICAVCRIVRTYLLIAVPLLAMVGFSSMSGDHEEVSPWFARVELINFLAALAIISLVVVVALRAYQEFWIPKKKQEKLETLVSQLRDDREEC